MSFRDQTVAVNSQPCSDLQLPDPTPLGPENRRLTAGRSADWATRDRQHGGPV